MEEVLKQLDVPSPVGESTFRVRLRFAKASTVANSLNILFAKGGSPPLRQNAPQPQPGVNPQQQQQQSTPAQTGFGLEQETREEGYFPWLGGQPDVSRGSDGRLSTRQVSDLVGRVRVVADQRSNALLVSANVHLFPQIKKLIEDLDTPTAQVLIEARIVEVSTDFMDKLGVRWSPDGQQVFTAEDYDNSILGLGGSNYRKGFGGNTDPRPLKPDAVTAALGSMRSGVLDASINMDILVQFLKKNVGATVLAEPQINIEDNEVGKLFVGSQVPFIDKSQSTDVGSLNQSFSYKDVGIILEVIPHINIAGDVALKIRVESSAIEPGQTLLGGAILNTRNFKSDVTAKSGETLVLGGIIQKQTSDTVRKVPGLGSVPGLGWAFKKKDKATRNVELLVFLRPRVVRTPEEARQLLEDVDKKSPQIQKLREGDTHSKTTTKSEKESPQLRRPVVAVNWRRSPEHPTSTSGSVRALSPQGGPAQLQHRGQKSHARDHARRGPHRHDITQGLNPLMIGKGQTAETRDRGQPRHQDRLARAFRENAGIILFGKAIEDVDAVGDPNPDHQRQGHNVRWIEGNAEHSHESHHPERPHRDRQQGQNHPAQLPEVDEDKQGDGAQRIPCRLHIAILQQRGVFQQLHRRPRDVRNDPPQITDELLLLVPPPHVVAGIDLKEVLA